MDIHKNARLTLVRREESAKKVVDDCVTLNSAAAELNVARTAHRPPRRTPAEQVEKVEALRRLRQTGVQIAFATGVSRATVSRILRRLMLNRMRNIEPAPPAVRYERDWIPADISPDPPTEILSSHKGSRFKCLRGYHLRLQQAPVLGPPTGGTISDPRVTSVHLSVFFPA